MYTQVHIILIKVHISVQVHL